MQQSTNFRRWLYALVVLLVIIAGLYLSSWSYGVLRACGNILALYFTAWLLSFFFTPIVDFLTRHHLPRLAAVAYVYLVLALAVVIAMIAVVPAIYSQTQLLFSALSQGKLQNDIYHAISNATLGIEDFLVRHFNVPKKDIQQFTLNYSVSLRHGVFDTGNKLQQMIKNFLTPSNIFSSASGFVSIFNTLSNALLNFVIVLLLAFYMTLDGPKLIHRAAGYFPPVVGETMESVRGIVNRKFGGYLRGQIILAASYGFLTYVITANPAFHLPYQLLIAIFAAVMMLIPFIGTFIALAPPIILYAVANPTFPLANFLILMVLLIGAQQIIINFLAPRVMGSAVGMHPLLVVLGLLLGVKIAGLWGAIFGVPVFGVILDTADLIYRRIMERRYGFHPTFYDGPDEDAGSGDGLTRTGPPEARSEAAPAKASAEPQSVSKASSAMLPSTSSRDLRT